MIKFVKYMIALSIGIALVMSTLAIAEAQKKVTLRTHHMWEATFIPVQKQFDEEFMVKHPNIVIKRSNATDWLHAIEKYLTQAAAGTLPDVFYIHFSWAQKLIREQVLINIQSYIERDMKEVDLDDFYPVSLTPFKLKGDIYILPYDAGANALFYNKEMFDKAGLAYPDWSWTLDKFLEVSKELTRDVNNDGILDQYGVYEEMWGNEMLGPMLKSFGGRLLNEYETECLLTEAASLEGLRWWSDLTLKHHVQPTPEVASAFAGGGVMDPFAFGQVAMTFGGSWMLERWITLGGFETDVAPVPEGPAGRLDTVAGSGYAVPKTTSHFDEAWTYLKEYLSVEGQKFMWGRTGRGSPTRRSAWSSFEESWKEKGLENVDVFKEMIPFASYARPYSPPAAQVNDIIQREFELLLLGRATVEQAAEKIKARVDPLLEANKKFIAE